jgi:HEPN domain-containing protein
MKPLDPGLESLLRQWIGKADADLDAAEQLSPAAADNVRRREIVGFHCQQSAEKYIKALLTYHQVDFPKTHHIGRLRMLVDTINHEAAEAMIDAEWLTPFGVETRYAGDAAEMLPGDEVKAIAMARSVKELVLRIMDAESQPPDIS